jgi:soluble lytic murein transglycosylase-like protein
VRRLLATALAGAVLAGTVGCGEETQPEPPRPSVADELGTDRPAKGPAAKPPPPAPPLAKRWVPAATARELAVRLTTAEALVRIDGAPDDVRDAAAFDTQLLYRQLARTPSWQRAVRGAVAPRYRADLDDHLTARRSLRSVLTTLSDEVPAWEIMEPAPTADLLRFYREGERTYGVAWELLAAVNLVETGFGKIRGLSTAGAQGPMQFIPSTWAAYGEGDIDDPHDAILGAAHYLAANGGDTATTSGAGVDRALYRYNNHQGYVDGIEAYAAIIERDPRALESLVRWQIVYLSTIGDLWLPIGYFETTPVPVRDYVAEHPERHLGTVTD